MTRRLAVMLASAAVAATIAYPAGATPQLRLVALGDIGMSRAAAATLTAAGRARPQLALLVGDLSYAGPRSERRWCRFVRPRLGNVPVELVSGNHEDDYGGDGKIARFAACLPPGLPAAGDYPRRYYVDVGTLARFIVISPDLTIGGRYYYFGAGNANQLWLERAIRGARSRGIRWVVVAMHKNCLSVGLYDCQVYEDLLNILVREHVDLVLHGHDHVYERTHAIAISAGCPRVRVDAFDPSCIRDRGDDGLYRKGAGTVFVDVGTGGAPLYPIDRHDPEVGYFATTMGANSRPRHGFLSLILTGGRLSARFVGTTGPSTFGDRFSIAAPGTRR